MVRPKIHWSTQTFPEFACEKKRRRYRRADCRGTKPGHVLGCGGRAPAGAEAREGLRILKGKVS